MPAKVKQTKGIAAYRFEQLFRCGFYMYFNILPKI